MKRLLAFLLAMILCLPLIVACHKEEQPPEETGTGTAAALPLITGGASEYVIVYSEATANQMAGVYQSIATLLQKHIKDLTGVELPVVSEKDAPVAKEIVVGATSRTVDYTSPVPAETYQKGYSLFAAGEKVVLEANCNVGIRLGMYALLQDLLGVDLLANDKAMPEEGKKDFSLASNYENSKTVTSEKVPFLNISVDQLGVCYGETYTQKRAAILLQQELKSIEKTTPECVARTNVKSDKVYFSFQTDKTVGGGEFRVAVSDKMITVLAKDYYGFVSAVRSIAKTRKSLGFYPYGSERTVTGSHVDHLLKYEESAKYAFNRSAEYRLMFYNVLWDNTEVAERGILQNEVLKAYDPDVIGFQEFHERRRTAIVADLLERGYAEAMNYKSGNFVSGSSGATKSNWYCYVPIFYKTATTKCVESGFYRYVSQYSVAESASKTLCWAVMEAKDSGDRYLVVNTHMCTQDDKIKGEQAVEAVKVIDKLLEKYNVPVFLGGDYNGRYTNANHKYFAGEGGFVDVVQGKLASEYTANIRAHHRPYPVFNKELGLMWPGVNEDGSKDDTGMYDATQSVDHIMVKNDYPVSIEVFGTVADEYTISGGDHFPIFIDFSIK